MAGLLLVGWERGHPVRIEREARTKLTRALLACAGEDARAPIEQD